MHRCVALVKHGIPKQDGLACGTLDVILMPTNKERKKHDLVIVCRHTQGPEQSKPSQRHECTDSIV